MRRLVLLTAAAGVAATAVACQPPPPPPPAGPPITVEDHTGSLWPVRSALSSWGLPNAAYAPCRLGARCVRVYEVAWIGSPQPGQAYTGWTSTSQPGVAMIRLADNPGERLSPAIRQETVCHELGHAWGLPHDSSGCMEPVVDGFPTGPSSSERALALAYTR